MQKRNEQSIGEVIRQYLKINQIESHVFEERIAAIWAETLGEAITRETDHISLQNGVLYVSLKSPSLRNEILMRRTAIGRALNEKLGQEVIKSVFIR